MADFRTVIIQLESLGLTDVLVPFILIFSVVFSILNLVKLFKRNISIIVALVISLLTVVPHVTKSYPACYDVVSIINAAIPKIGFVLIAILMFLLVVGIFGINLDFFKKALPVIVLIILVVVIISFVTSPNNSCAFNIKIPEMSSLFYYLIPLGVLVLIVIFAVSGKPPAEKKKPEPHPYRPY
jgi:hypothetical protein